MLAHGDIVRQAHILEDLLGLGAEARAAQKATEEKIAGHAEAAEDWRKIREVLRQRKGAHES